MPNPSGLRTLDEHLALGPGVRQNGPHTFVEVASTHVELFDAGKAILASLNRDTEAISVATHAIDGSTSMAVNRFLVGRGKVKNNWRKPEEYRFYPATPDTKVAPLPPTVAAPAAPAAVAPTVSVPVVAAPAAPAAVAAPSFIDTEVFPPAKPLRVTKVGQGHTAYGQTIVTNRAARSMETSYALTMAGRPAAAIITGPAGTAKTRFAHDFAFSKGLSVIKVDGGTVAMASDWFGSMAQNEDGTLYWEWSDLAKAAMRGTPCLVVVDEINRSESARSQAGLFGFLDWTGLVKPVGAPHAIRRPASMMIVATLNEGPEFVGTVEVDGALRDRFPWGIRMEYVPAPVEARLLTTEFPTLDKDVAKRLVRVAHTQRAKRMDDSAYPSGNVLSTRVMFDIASAIALAGAEPVDAIWDAAAGRFWPEDEVQLRIAIEAQFGAGDAEPPVIEDDEDLDHLLTESGLF